MAKPRSPDPDREGAMPDGMNDRDTAAVLDEYLVVQSQLGDAEAFRRLVSRWNGRLLRRAHVYTRSVEAAKDVSQEAWIAIVRGLHSLHDPARFPAWAFRIVANRARDWVRREEARRRYTHRFGADEPTGPDASDPDSFERVRTGLAGMEPAHRRVLDLFYIDGMSVDEIARMLAIPAGTVKSRLFYARNALRARLREA
jgi:RNA polymerase sigma factor (sigma-70 family)